MKRVLTGLQPFLNRSLSSGRLLRALSLRSRSLVTAGCETVACEGSALKTLTFAALAIPGLTLSQGVKAVMDDPVSLQYGYYKQTPWQLYDGLKSQYKPLQVSNIEANGLLNFEDRWKFSFSYVQDTWSGATPVTSAPYALGGNNPTPAGASPLVRGNSSILYDKRLTPWRLDADTASYVPDKRLVQTVASASTEIRNAGSFRLGKEWEDMAFNVAGGVSDEPDYSSGFGGINGLFYFDQKRTALNYGIDYTNSSVYALINPSYAPYVNKSYYIQQGQIQVDPGPYGVKIEHITGNRDDLNFHLNLSQVMNRDLLLESGIGLVQSSGYLGNPYKAVDMVFVDTKAEPVPPDEESGLPPLWDPTVEAVVERRPDYRTQGIWDLRLVQYVPDFDAAIHGGYRFYLDSWGISAHTFDIDWVQPVEDWTITPRFRYYSQNGASFYEPYFLFSGAAPTRPNGQFNLAGVPLDAYSSDWRLAAYGSFSAGVTVARPIGKALGFEAGFEWYTHGGDLRMGGEGKGQGTWSNVQYYQFNAALRVDLAAVTNMGNPLSEDSHTGHEGHEGHHDHRQTHIGMDAPAGIMFNHMLAHAGDAMVGVRYNYSFQSGNMMHGTSPVPDSLIVETGCWPGPKCRYTPKTMDMSMAMVDLMYAPTDWLTLMLMPMFMSMDMHLRALEGAPAPSGQDIHAAHGVNPAHETGGVGDTYLGALFELYEAPGHKVHLTAGLTAPTGSVTETFSGNSTYEHYMMQLGSGTWNAWPSLTYNGFSGDFNWGGQLSGNMALGGPNESGYSVGTLFQSTAWGSYQIEPWLAGSVRALFMSQAQIWGRYPPPYIPAGPMDVPQNYGGKYLDIGIGLNGSVESGEFKGNHFAIEWLQPAWNDYNGYQLERKGALWANWSLSF